MRYRVSARAYSHRTSKITYPTYKPVFQYSRFLRCRVSDVQLWILLFSPLPKPNPLQTQLFHHEYSENGIQSQPYAKLNWYPTKGLSCFSTHVDPSTALMENQLTTMHLYPGELPVNLPFVGLVLDRYIRRSR